VFLVDAFACVYVCIQLYCSCCQYGVIKHDDDDDDGDDNDDSLYPVCVCVCV